jgi:hypothetical protein
VRATDYQALVELPMIGGGSKLALYDSLSNSLSSVAENVGFFAQPQFVGTSQFAYINNSGTLVARDITGGAEQPLVQPDNGFHVAAFGVTGDGSGVAYLQVSGATQRLTLREMSGKRDFASLASPLGRDGSPYDQTLVSFSHDGKYILMVDTLGGDPQGDAQKSRMQVRDRTGNLVYTGEDTQPGMPQARQALWSPVDDIVYFADSRGGEMLDVRTGAKTTVLPGVQWTWPSLSLDGKLLAYTTTIGGKIAVQVYDLRKSTVIFTRFNRSHPRFLTPDTVCYMQESPVPTAPFTLAGTVPTGTVLAYDFTTQHVVNLPFANVDPTYAGLFSVPDVRAT